MLDAVRDLVKTSLKLSYIVKLCLFQMKFSSLLRV